MIYKIKTFAFANNLCICRNNNKYKKHERTSGVPFARNPLVKKAEREALVTNSRNFKLITINANEISRIDQERNYYVSAKETISPSSHNTLMYRNSRELF